MQSASSPIFPNGSYSDYPIDAGGGSLDKSESLYLKLTSQLSTFFNVLNLNAKYILIILSMALGKKYSDICLKND